MINSMMIMTVVVVAVAVGIAINPPFSSRSDSSHRAIPDWPRRIFYRKDSSRI